MLAVGANGNGKVYLSVQHVNICQLMASLIGMCSDRQALFV